MSQKIIDIVLKTSQHKGSALLLMLAIAKKSNDKGEGATPSNAELAEGTRLSRRSIMLLKLNL